MKIWTGIFIDLSEINSLKLWIESTPESFTDSHDKEQYNIDLIESRVVLNNINKLYQFIEETTLKQVDVSSNSFDIGMLEKEKHDYYKQLVNSILKSNIMKYNKVRFEEEKGKHGISEDKWFRGNLACKQYFEKVKKYDLVDYDSANKKYN